MEKLVRVRAGPLALQRIPEQGQAGGAAGGARVVRHGPDSPTAGENGREIDCKSHKRPIACLSKIYAIEDLIVQLVIEMVGCFSGVFLH
jgi:hypothetical protein